MSLEFTAEVWQALRGHIETHDRKHAAETMVTLLVENNFDAADIKEAFRGDKDVANALRDYIDQHDADDEEYVDDDYLYDDDYED